MWKATRMRGWIFTPSILLYTYPTLHHHCTSMAILLMALDLCSVTVLGDLKRSETERDAIAKELLALHVGPVLSSDA